MKGVVFTEFLELVEHRFGHDVADQIITNSKLPNDGAYTAVGTYNPEEFVRLASALSNLSGIDVPSLLMTYGEYLFGKLAAAHPQFLEDLTCTFDLFRCLHDVIHGEVKKLCPDAELPDFFCESQGRDALVLHYQSPRGFADLAEGLIRGCAVYYKETLTVDRDDLSNGRGTDVRFLLRRFAA